MSRNVDFETMPTREKMNPLWAVKKASRQIPEQEAKGKWNRVRRTHSIQRDRMSDHLHDGAA